MKGFISALFGLVLLSVVVPASAKQTVAVDYLVGEGDLTGIRLAYRPITNQLIDVPYLGDLQVYWEVSVNFWEFGETNQHETNYVLALSPVFTKEFATLFDKYPVMWEFGIGVSLVDDTRFAGKDIGSHYQFEDRLGLIFALDESRDTTLTMRYMHYSNGGLNDNNPGMDFFNVSLAKRF